MISVRFQGKPFNITVIQVYAPTTGAEEAEVEWFYEDLQDLLKLTPKNMSFSSEAFIYSPFRFVFFLCYKFLLLFYLETFSYFF